MAAAPAVIIPAIDNGKVRNLAAEIQALSFVIPFCLRLQKYILKRAVTIFYKMLNPKYDECLLSSSFLIFENKSMKNSTTYNITLLFLRVAFGGMMLTHGIPKFLNLVSGDFSFVDPIGIGQPASLILAVLAEVVFPMLVIIGFKTRLASIPVILTMLVALFVHHANDAFGIKEKAILYLIGFITIALLGAGKYSVDKK